MRLVKRDDVFDICEISEHELSMLANCLAAYQAQLEPLMASTHDEQIEKMEKSRSASPEQVDNMTNEEMLDNFKKQYDFIKTIVKVK